MQLTARTQEKHWVIRPTNDGAAQLGVSLKVSPLLGQILINRGITDADAGSIFLRPRLSELIPPQQMPGIEKAIARIAETVKGKEKITIYGDYDVDGITAVAILWQLLTMLGADVDYYIPHRVEEGYGLNTEAIESLARAGSKLIITVDCGITAVKSAELAKSLGIEMVITDHHQPADELPEAAAIVHPALDESYPNQNSSGSMVAFKLAWAIANEFTGGKKLDPPLREFMINATTLAAVGTVADIMDMRGENRILTGYGLKSIPDCKLVGVQALIESANLTGRDIDSFHIGFRLAPVLNAAGRMGHARLAVELITSQSSVRAAKIAEYLKDQNDQRRRCERKIFKQACEMVAERGLNHPDRKSIVLAGENWHTGVIGIVASRIVDRFYRPAIMINTTDGKAQGSARSIAGFDILGAITACSDHLLTFGGHKMAAGIRIATENIEQFTADIEAYAQENLTEADVVEKIEIDALAPLAKLSREMVFELQMLGPFGQGNPQPIFATKGVRLVSQPRRVGANGDHLQIAISDGTASVRCVGFGMGKLEKKMLNCDFFNVAYQPQINTYNGNTNVELLLCDVRFE